MRLYKIRRVSDEYKEMFREDSGARNLNIFLLMSLCMSLLQMALIVFQYVRLGTMLFELEYFTIYVMTSITFAVFFVIYYGYKHKKLIKRRVLTDIFFIGCVYLVTLLTAIEELRYGAHDGVMFLAVSIFILSVVNIDIKVNRRLLIMANIIYVVILVNFLKDQNELIGSLLNALVVFVTNIFASIPMHNDRVQRFEQKIEIERTNEMLKNTNASLESFNKQLEATATTDALTKVGNRMAFENYLETVWEKSIASGDSLSLIMLDIDDFKSFNDTYGHVEGDECLIKVAQTTESSLKRTRDRVFRYGGEEFVVLLPGVNVEGSRIVAERIVMAMQDISFKNTNESVTVSAGVHTVAPTKNDDKYIILQKADYALYYAKNNGKNQFARFDEISKN